jgi:hypothetical protein
MNDRESHFKVAIYFAEPSLSARVVTNAMGIAMNSPSRPLSAGNGLWLAAGGRFSSGKTKEYRERAIQSHRILVVEFSDALAQPRFRYSGDFIDHES